MLIYIGGMHCLFALGTTTKAEPSKGNKLKYLYSNKVVYIQVIMNYPTSTYDAML